MERRISQIELGGISDRLEIGAGHFSSDRQIVG
jgi:hypothetical protein